MELFRTNRYVGADRVGDANQVSAGVTTRLLNALDGRQYLTATFGQELYFTTPRVTLPGELPRTDRRSDLVAQLALTAFQHWSADAALQWDPQTSADAARARRGAVPSRPRSGHQSGLSLRARHLRGERPSVQPAQPAGQTPVCGHRR